MHAIGEFSTSDSQARRFSNIAGSGIVNQAMEYDSDADRTRTGTMPDSRTACRAQDKLRP